MYRLFPYIHGLSSNNTLAPPLGEIPVYARLMSIYITCEYIIIAIKIIFKTEDNVILGSFCFEEFQVG